MDLNKLHKVVTKGNGGEIVWWCCLTVLISGTLRFGKCIVHSCVIEKYLVNIKYCVYWSTEHILWSSLWFDQWHKITFRCFCGLSELFPFLLHPYSLSSVMIIFSQTFFINHLFIYLFADLCLSKGDVNTEKGHIDKCQCRCYPLCLGVFNSSCNSQVSSWLLIL